MRRLLPLVAWVSLVCGLTFVSSPTIGQELPRGTFTVTLSVFDVKSATGVPPEELVGKWTISIGESGAFTIKHPDTEVVVEGSYVVHGDQVVFTDRVGKYACLVAGQAQGTYRWKRDGGSLSFTRVKDECPVRIAALASRPYTLVQLHDGGRIPSARADGSAR